MNRFDALRAAVRDPGPPWMEVAQGILQEWAEWGEGWTVSELIRTLPKPPSSACVGELMRLGQESGLIERAGSVTVAGDGPTPKVETQWRGTKR